SWARLLPQIRHVSWGYKGSSQPPCHGGFEETPPIRREIERADNREGEPLTVPRHPGSQPDKGLIGPSGSYTRFIYASQEIAPHAGQGRPRPRHAGRFSERCRVRDASWSRPPAS